jgi:hypothetical protein
VVVVVSDELKPVQQGQQKVQELQESYGDVGRKRSTADLVFQSEV